MLGSVRTFELFQSQVPGMSSCVQQHCPCAVQFATCASTDTLHMGSMSGAVHTRCVRHSLYHPDLYLKDVKTPLETRC